MATMTKDDREMLIRIDERTNEMHKVLKGNGQPGLIKRFDVVEMNQEACMQSKVQKRLDLKWIVITLLGVAEAWSVYRGWK